MNKIIIILITIVVLIAGFFIFNIFINNSNYTGEDGYKIYNRNCERNSKGENVCKEVYEETINNLSIDDMCRTCWCRKGCSDCNSCGCSEFTCGNEVIKVK